MNINGNAQSFCTLWLESKTETPNLIPQRANKTGSVVDMSFLWIRNTALIKALGIFRANILVKMLAGAVLCLTFTFAGTKKDCHSRLNILILLFLFSCDLYVSSGLRKWAASFSSGDHALAVVAVVWHSDASMSSSRRYRSSLDAPDWDGSQSPGRPCLTMAFYRFIPERGALVAATLRRVMSKGGCDFLQEPQWLTSQPSAC